MPKGSGGEKRPADVMGAAVMMGMSHIVELIDDAEAAPKKRGPYKKKAA